MARATAALGKATWIQWWCSPSGNTIFYGVVKSCFSEWLHIDILGGEDRFEVDAESGVVRTRDNQPFRPGKEYEIGVSAQDKGAVSSQKSPTHSLRILVGERNPQFYKTQYEAPVREDAHVQDP